MTLEKFLQIFVSSKKPHLQNRHVSAAPPGCFLCLCKINTTLDVIDVSFRQDWCPAICDKYGQLSFPTQTSNKAQHASAVILVMAVAEWVFFSVRHSCTWQIKPWQVKEGPGGHFVSAWPLFTLPSEPFLSGHVGPETKKTILLFCFTTTEKSYWFFFPELQDHIFITLIYH